MAPNEKQGTNKGGASKNFYVYREPGLSDAEYEKIKRNMLDYRNTMDRVLEAHSTPPNRITALQKEKPVLLRKSKEMQDSRGVKAPDSKHAKSLGKDRLDRDARAKGAENGRDRQSQGRS
ncbi:MAG: hypothetical protein ASARMPRED_002705 [Alectoria sarmentosa]|nr:MAG: hypothetical protein ASARMPRED_002705 [Alectoria sarmentosa]